VRVSSLRFKPLAGSTGGRRELPRFPSLLAPSHDQKRYFYEVGLVAQHHVSRFSLISSQTQRERHLIRCRKHVFRAYARLEPQSDCPSWLGEFLDLSWPTHPRSGVTHRVDPPGLGLLFGDPAWCSSLQRQTVGRTFSPSITVDVIVTATMSMRIAGSTRLNPQP
jgi:hypothetical protein